MGGLVVGVGLLGWERGVGGVRGWGWWRGVLMGRGRSGGWIRALISLLGVGVLNGGTVWLFAIALLIY